MYRGVGDSPGGYNAVAGSTQEPVISSAIGKIKTAIGAVTIARASAIIAQPVVDDFVYEGDVIETGIDGLVGIVFVDGTTFQLYANARIVLNEFIYGAEKSSHSALFHVAKGKFGFIGGKMATAGRLIIDTPFGKIQNAAPAAGIGSLALIFLSCLIDDVQASIANNLRVDDGTVDLPFGLYEILTNDPIPKLIVVYPGELVVLKKGSGGTVSVDHVAITPAQFLQQQGDYRDTQVIYSQAKQDPFIQQLQQGPNLDQHANAQPQTTGSTGSSTPPPPPPPTTTVDTTPPPPPPPPPPPTTTTVDTTPPPPPPPPPSTPPVQTAPSIAITTPITGDNVINATEAAAGIAISGTTEIGASVGVNGVAATVDGSGNWTVTLPAPGSDGALLVTATATDADGNTASTSTTLTVDTATAVAITAIEGGDTTINATEAAAGIAISGTTEIGASVDVNGVAATVDGSGNWTVTLPAPGSDGALLVTATATDADGNTASTSTTLTVDTATAVAITAIEGGDTTINATEAAGGIAISGTTEIGASVDVNGVAATVDGSGNWTVTLPAPGSDGALLVTATATDADGNTASTSTTLTVDTATAVAITAIEGGDTTINATEAAGGIAISGTTEIGASVDVNGVAATVDGSGNWTVTLPAPGSDGALLVTATATDADGNTASTSTTLTVDTATAVAITAIEGGDTTINATEAAGGIAISGTTEIGASVDVNGVAATVDGSGNWTVTLPAPGSDGALLVTATATDADGNTASTSTTLTVDTVAPTIAIDANLELDDRVNASEDNTFTVSGTTTGVENGQTVSVTVSDGAGGHSVDTTATVLADGSWTATDVNISGFVNGPITVTADVSDVAGNPAPQADTTVTLDNVAPTIAIDANLELDDRVNASEDNTFTVSGTTTGVENGQTVSVTVSDGAGGHSVDTTATVLADGSWTATDVNISGFVNGPITVTADVSDVAGNAAPQADTTVTLDNVAPTIAIDANLELDDRVNASEDNTFTVSGTTTGVENGQTVSVTVSDGAGGHSVDTTATVLADGSWTATDVNISGFVNGPITVTADVSDVAGNPAPQADTTVTLDNVAPTVTIDIVDSGAERHRQQLAGDLRLQRGARRQLHDRRHFGHQRHDERPGDGRRHPLPRHLHGDDGIEDTGSVTLDNDKYTDAALNLGIAAAPRQRDHRHQESDGDDRDRRHGAERYGQHRDGEHHLQRSADQLHARRDMTATDGSYGRRLA